MLRGYHPVLQSLMGTFLTWGLTAAGAALVFVFQGGQVCFPLLHYDIYEDRARFIICPASKIT